MLGKLSCELERTGFMSGFFSSTMIFSIGVFCSLQPVSCLHRGRVQGYLGNDVESGRRLMMTMTDDAFDCFTLFFCPNGIFFSLAGSLRS